MHSLPRIFVSHSKEDAAFAERLVDDLRAHDLDVWLDATHITGGSFIDRINRALSERDVVLLILSPAALAPPWVRDEVNTNKGPAIAPRRGALSGPLRILGPVCEPPAGRFGWLESVAKRWCSALRPVSDTVAHRA
jgi:hypothetical protein